MAQLLKNSEGFYFYLVEKADDRTYKVYPYGGGFVYTAPASDFEEVTGIPKHLNTGVASLDGEGSYPCVYNPHDRWNGWAKPYFTDEVFEQIVRDQDLPVNSRTSNEVKWLYDEENVGKALKTQWGWQFDGWCWDVADAANHNKEE